MPRTFLKEYKDGDSVDDVFLLADRQLRANRNADLYLLATLRDKTGVMSGLMWNVTEESVARINTGDFVRVRGKVQLYQGGLQMIVNRIESVPENGLDPADFHPQTARDVEPLFERMREILLGMKQSDIRSLMQLFVDDEPLMNAFMHAPAGVKAHHAYPGGLIEHVVNMLEMAARIAGLYPQVDFDLVQAGILLHDIGKVRELDYDTTLTYTDEGQLVGHMTIGIEMLNEKLTRFHAEHHRPVSEETVLRLKHMILSHHGTYEFGSSRLPMTPEAVALHHIDNLDAKIHEFSQAISEDPNGDSHWTPYSPRMARKLFKGSGDSRSDDSIS